MKICIYGAGAIGGFLAARLAGTAAEVSLVARGAHLAAMRDKGLVLLSGEQQETVRVNCTDDPRTLGVQDFVLITLKAHSVLPALDDLATLLGPDTAVVTAQNGILWWYFHALPGPYLNHHLQAADPGGRIWQALGPERAIGCVVYPSCEIVEPGVIRHIDGTRFMVGEPDGSRSARVTALAELLTSAGLKAPVRRRIRDDIWFKLLGNASFNPASVLTRATLGQMGHDRDVRQILRLVMTEAMAVATALDVKFAMDIEQRLDAGMKVGDHRTSMLQDFEQGRQLELDALVTSVAEMGRLVNVATPTLDQLLALTRLAVIARDASQA
ncbi:MAG: 2-dehydropantoate 2-reductase [Gammaproteobacteria bacterium]